MHRRRSTQERSLDAEVLEENTGMATWKDLEVGDSHGGAKTNRMEFQWRMDLTVIYGRGGVSFGEEFIYRLSGKSDIWVNLL